MKKLITIILLCPLIGWAQKPFINSISPTHVEVGQSVTISGINFSGSPKVYFGGVEASVSSNTNNTIEAIVPAAATNNSIYVVNNGLIAQSSQHFFISFVGSDISNYDSEYTQTTNEKSASNLCMCDLNNDGKNDVVLIHNIQSTDNSQNEVSIFINNSSGVGPFSGSVFNLTQLNISSNSSGFFSVSCADLDNDGDNDLAFSSNLGTNAADIFVLAGSGTGSFSSTPTLTKTLPNLSNGDQRLPGSIESADMDGDGRLDLVVGNRTDGVFHIYRNTGNLTFDDAIEISAQNENTGLIKIADFNNDGYQDITTLAFRESGTSIHLFKNNSTLNNFNFLFQQTISNGGQTSDIEVGDLNGDDLLDIVVASNVSGKISRFLNLSSSGAISFGSETSISTTSTAAFGVNLGDMNGDGQLDIVASNGAGNIFVYENDGAGSFSNEQVLTTSASTQSIMVGDLNGDAKPDMAYSQDVQTNGPIGKLGVILNRNCIEPVIAPLASEGTFCATPQNFTLSATFSPNATYTWEIVGGSNTDLGSGTTSTTNTATFQLQNPSPTTIKVTINEGDGSCNTNSVQQTYNVSGTQTSPAPTISGVSGVVCAGESITLSATKSGVPYDSYYWIKPDGSVSTDQQIVLNPVSTSDAGLYTLRVSDGSECLSPETSLKLEVSEVPSFEILNNNLDDFCNTSSVALEVPDFSSEYNYQWVLNGSTNLGTTPTQTASQGGNYTVVITEKATSGCTFTTPSYTINAVNPPNSVANGPTERCVGLSTSFTSASTGDAGFTLDYEWIVNNGTSDIFTATTQDLDFTFPSAGTYTVTLTTSYPNTEVYAGGESNVCESTDIINVTVSDPPTSLTFSEADGVQKCQGDDLDLSITDTGIATYTWSVKDASDLALISAGVSTTNNLSLTTPAGVDSVYAIVDVVTSIGCTVRDSIKVKNFPSNLDITSADFDVSPDSVTLEEVNTIDLSIGTTDGSMSNFTNIRWRPNEIISDSTASTVTVFPNQPSTIVTLLATDENGCTLFTTLKIILDNLRPKRTFSPNGDGRNDCWEILNSSQLDTDDECKIFVFDAKGSKILERNAPFENNCVWDGTFNGTPVPEGVYYFVLKCNDSQMSKTGSILLAR